MANESSKSKRVWGDLERAVLRGEGIDIGCGSDPVLPGVMPFDIADGDANEILRHVHRQFDFVYASHCLEHMRDPRAAIAQWWQLVRPGGALFVIVPDEDLYEQGVFPSRFNPDHKATFTIAKARSWSPVSINVLDLARALPGGELVSLVLQDHGYDRSLLRHQSRTRTARVLRFPFRVYNGLRRRGLPRLALIDLWQARFAAVDQTLLPGVLAQIQCIVQKATATHE